MFKLRITSAHNTFIEAIYCLTLKEAMKLKARLESIGLVARVFNVL